jgi:hypothetical protein
MRGDGGEPYEGSSWSRACGSSKELRNLAGGDSEPSTEFNNDIMLSVAMRGWCEERKSSAAPWSCCTC